MGVVGDSFKNVLDDLAKASGLSGRGAIRDSNHVVTLLKGMADKGKAKELAVRIRSSAAYNEIFNFGQRLSLIPLVGLRALIGKRSYRVLTNKGITVNIREELFRKHAGLIVDSKKFTGAKSDVWFQKGFNSQFANPKELAEAWLEENPQEITFYDFLKKINEIGSKIFLNNSLSEANQNDYWNVWMKKQGQTIVTRKLLGDSSISTMDKDSFLKKALDLKHEQWSSGPQKSMSEEENQYYTKMWLDLRLSQITDKILSLADQSQNLEDLKSKMREEKRNLLKEDTLFELDVHELKMIEEKWLKAKIPEYAQNLLSKNSSMSFETFIQAMSEQKQALLAQNPFFQTSLTRGEKSILNDIWIRNWISDSNASKFRLEYQMWFTNTLQENLKNTTSSKPLESLQKKMLEDKKSWFEKNSAQKVLAGSAEFEKENLTFSENVQIEDAWIAKNLPIESSKKEKTS